MTIILSSNAIGTPFRVVNAYKVNYRKVKLLLLMWVNTRLSIGKILKFIVLLKVQLINENGVCKFGLVSLAFVSKKALPTSKLDK